MYVKKVDAQACKDPTLYWLSLKPDTLQLNPWNCAWTVSDRCESSTTESIGSSDVNSSSKLDVSIALAWRE